MQDTTAIAQADWKLRKELDAIRDASIRRECLKAFYAVGIRTTHEKEA